MRRRVETLLPLHDVAELIEEVGAADQRDLLVVRVGLEVERHFGQARGRVARLRQGVRDGQPRAGEKGCALHREEAVQRQPLEGPPRR